MVHLPVVEEWLTIKNSIKTTWTATFAASSAAIFLETLTSQYHVGKYSLVPGLSLVIIPACFTFPVIFECT